MFNGGGVFIRQIWPRKSRLITLRQTPSARSAAAGATPENEVGPISQLPARPRTIAGTDTDQSRDSRLAA